MAERSETRQDQPSERQDAEPERIYRRSQVAHVGELVFEKLTPSRSDEDLFVTTIPNRFLLQPL
jgi:hypothetical protein